MLKKWQIYQQQAADFFTKLGLHAEIEKKVDGARGSHEIDVYVEGKYKGIDFKWIVECKAWSSTIPKEKVMALYSIVQDIGADRGFLLSEIGFQSGAIKAAHRSNITLTSIQDMLENTEEYLLDSLLEGLFWRISKELRRLRDIKRKKYNEQYYPPTMEPLGKIGFLDIIIHDALALGSNEFEYPINLTFDKREGYEANNLFELLLVANKLVTEVEEWQAPEI